MNTAVSDQIAALPAMSKAQLLAIWAKNFREAPPSSLRKDLMVPILAYRIQEREYGGLANTTRKKLREIAKSIDPGKQAQGRGTSSLHRGTRLVRSWKGEVHEVQVLNAAIPIAASHSAICPRSRERLPEPVGPAPCSSERR